MQELRHTVANATDTTVLPEQNRATNCAETGRLSLTDGLTKSGKRRCFWWIIRRKSVGKYQIVRSAQNALCFRLVLRAKGRVRNLVKKSCKKELIPSIAYDIVSIILVKMKSFCARQDARTGPAFWAARLWLS